MAIGVPRTSLIRCGVTTETGIWNAGYEGRSESLMVVLSDLHTVPFSLFK
jgi:dUTP pyrophosphatase